MHIQNTQEYARRHAFAQRQRFMQNVKQRATPTQWRCVVLPSTALWIYWLLCGVQIHPSCKNVSSGLLRAAAASVFWLSVGAKAPPLLLSTHYNQRRALGATWSLAGWLSSLQSADCERGHLSGAVRVSGEREGRGGMQVAI